jgi:predicted metalloprotease with PDZ domain
MRFTPALPELVELTETPPQGAMWRGGLSGPGSLFIHADRPLLSENGTSTLVHELVHVANELKAENNGDWIVEGLAEYYSLKLMWRSGTITDNRYKAIFRTLEKWALDAERLDVERSTGAVTARAVGVMRKLDREIHSKTERKKSLDDVVRHLMTAKQKVNRDRLRQAVVEIMGEPADSLSDEQLGF